MKKILIVGGSKGIGKAILEQNITNNQVYNLSRTPPNEAHPNLTHFTIDVLHDALPQLEAIDTLIYCPGSINLKPFDKLTEHDFRNDFDINVMGAIKVIQHYLPILKKGNQPNVLLFSTVATKLGMPYHASIAVAKAGVEGLVKSLGAEWASSIRINAIAPTLTQTSLASNLLRNDRLIAQMKERHPMKNFLQPEEVAQMAQFLTSEQAKAISGQIFEMDYGIVHFKM
ncbi:oxidoreductase [Flavobacterium branchiophilum]|uniref:NAD(P)-dependent dehydrogenase (Short-subunit alcohol dehydrogenase family) n=1 Tax=Flavobacterium branchiophilum TaxID=55197 RepID=A0A543G490_9FLAO|nr:SDR family oxidoreductase [Flavobacterium branchiophilum]OXA72587.1 oxidoreductase [Flavobacterium branchiophilum] [Flavobacterium branchiophilum NBRC 15030 = ATCC 35035]TQM40906.1 NAD(P)-dependent dehydrogenase (short-subunit alcohol dehydrogenase family) [Flavobacterium branchiophilum]GEM56353.1 oxidoreductase [Flavobacterium branchiophilum NBRC 15030 = ATCC 35035]